MKNINICIVLIAMLFLSCEKIVDIDVPTIEPKLIIDASFQVLFDQLPVTANTVVKLKLSADYFDETIPTVSNATVFLTNLSDNTIIPFSDLKNNGDYTPIISFIPEDNRVYELTVIHENETYKGKANKVKSTIIESVIQGDETLFSGEETEVKVAFTDNLEEENYYLFDFTNNLFTALEDRFFNGTDYNFSFFYQEEEIEIPTNVTVRMSGITKDYFTYFRILQNQSGSGGGGPFESVPSSLLGNMINTTNENNFPLGYFHISETDTFNIELAEKK